MKRSQNKSALGKSGMRNFKIVFADGQVAVKKNVEIEGARAVCKSRRPHAAELAFHGQQSFQQTARRQLRFERHNGVQKPRLVGKADWRGGVKRRAPDHAPKRAKLRRRGGQCSFRHARRAGQVRAKSDVSDGHTPSG